MKIKRLKIENFKAIKKIEVDNLEDAIVIAGPNGSGKTCIFDAIRFLKSHYGEQSNNEIGSWFGEFQINMNRLNFEIQFIANDKSKASLIEIDFLFTQSEVDSIRNNAKQISMELAKTRLYSRYEGMGRQNYSSLIYQKLDDHETQKIADIIYDDIVQASNSEIQSGRVSIFPNPTIGTYVDISDNMFLAACFDRNAPNDIGVFEYQTAFRNYARETIGGIHLNIEDSNDNRKNYLLYNTSNKYSNIKSEMASHYVRELVAREAGLDTSDTPPISSSLKELFSIFFDGKIFDGPRPTSDGKLSFEVINKDGSRHDINELSSGEKEIVFGYLRLRNSAPRNSIILMDEPELHLNPRLISRLPQFYRNHIGLKLGNQVWLITHSDLFLREAIKGIGFSVFHMRSPLDEMRPEGQLIPIDAESEAKSAIIDLVGYLPAYDPASKTVIVEGGGDSEFDKYFIEQVFPDFSNTVNLISGGNKLAVNRLHDLIEKLKIEGRFYGDIFSIVDRDSDDSTKSSEFRKIWDVYHIENYLLDADLILRVLKDNFPARKFDRSQIDSALLHCAEMIQDKIVAHEITSFANKVLLEIINFNYDPKLNPAKGVFDAMGRIEQNLKSILSSELSIINLRDTEATVKNRLAASLLDGSWKREFPGRRILQTLIPHLSIDLNYTQLRNQIVARMRDERNQPPGMKSLIEEIISHGAN